MAGESHKLPSLDDPKEDDAVELEATLSSSSSTATATTSNEAHKSRAKPSLPIDIKLIDQGSFNPRERHLQNGEECGPEEQMPIILKAANTMSSMMMAHRIALEDDFRLEPGLDMSGPLMSLSPIIGSSPTQEMTSDSPSLQSRVKELVHEAYWDLLKEELSTQTSLSNKEDKKFDMSLQLLSDIKHKIIDLLLPQHTRLKQDIEDRLDLEIITQLCKNNSFDLIDYAKYILNVLSKLCAPVRDEKIQELNGTTDILQLYRGIVELLELMRLDFANFTLNRFKPHIKAHSHDYEREKFNEILKQQEIIGIDGLEYTKIWLSRAVDRVDLQQGISELINQLSSSRQDCDDQAQENASSPILESSYESDILTSTELSPKEKVLKSDIVNKVLNSAYCELLEWSPELQRLYPETLLFDEATFKQIGEQIRTLIMTSCILLITFAFYNRFKLPDSPEFKCFIKSHLITLLTSSFENLTSSTKIQTSDSLLDQAKLETVVVQLKADLKQKIESTDKSLIAEFERQSELFRRQILDVQSSGNRVRELARRRIFEFAETLMSLDAKHAGNKSSKPIPPVNIPLGLNCLTDEITLTMAQLVKIIRYNRRVFNQRYQDIIVDLVLKKL